ncbi:Poly-beta-1,6-N-acetyl-D-glucosamine N-deacetylase precursor [Clostridium liquoris]|uniref:Poly-beta-1,6-N-acetyl-D-glucosamine N-deacetylase n=1 Tax=Clostridium liquoris TaxID=1289519 RepID=A0A2T0B704_9CLOT|nr:glycoside hydrolase [Clostridium liquoris]PRR79688.1 Poly-beta-1,6-N-acetyl-D-glucosamine N-deacetylase precursor [Clostridium liquoris]
MKNKSFSPKRKDRVKIIRGTVQGIILFVILLVIIKALFTFSVYEPYSSNSISKDGKGGFIAVSYFGVDRTGNDTLISTEALEKQIKALKDNGYVTITQQDILDYYNKGKALPEKSLFLLFEDGRRDTATFSQKVLEKYNYKATILTYADKFAKKDTKFLMPKDLLKLKDSSYWELGTNGYRLEYINVFDKDSNYLGNLNSVQFSKASSKIDRKYNHYLMDYIRDEHGIPMETYEEMKQRINKDYESLSNIYKKDIGYLPSLYALMHSNTGQFGTNDKASEVNGKDIKKLFSMNFNREGDSLNLSNSSIYDLTRVQPQAYWSTNHLLMRIWDDTKRNTEFVVGDEEKASKFKEIKGQAEFVDDKIIVTSLPKETGLIKLLNSENYKDIKISTTLKGNVIGSQSIYLRSNEDLSSSICVQLINNVVNVIESSNGNKKILYSLDLNHKNKQIDVKEPGNKKIDITLADEKLTLAIDGKNIVEDLKVSNKNEGSVYLQCTWGEYGYSQKNIADDVYDGIFEGFKVTNINNEVLYDSSLKGMEALTYNIKSSFNKIVNWFIENL